MVQVCEKAGGKEPKILVDYAHCLMCCRSVTVEDTHHELEFDVEEAVENISGASHVLLMRYMVKTYKW